MIEFSLAYLLLLFVLVIKLVMETLVIVSGLHQLVPEIRICSRSHHGPSLSRGFKKMVLLRDERLCHELLERVVLDCVITAVLELVHPVEDRTLFVGREGGNIVDEVVMFDLLVAEKESLRKKGREGKLG